MSTAPGFEDSGDTCQKGTFDTHLWEPFLACLWTTVRKAWNLGFLKKIQELARSGTKVASCIAKEWCGCQNSPLHDREVR